MGSCALLGCDPDDVGRPGDTAKVPGRANKHRVDATIAAAAAVAEPRQLMPPFLLLLYPELLPGAKR